MRKVTRREFVQEAAFGAAALGAWPAKWLGDGRTQKAAVDPEAIRKLAGQIRGRVITPEAAEYETARLVFNRAFDTRPAAIVRCSGAPDVARVLEFVQKQNLPLAVRTGGHNRAGLTACEGGVVMDLSPMNRV